MSLWWEALREEVGFISMSLLQYHSAPTFAGFPPVSAFCGRARPTCISHARWRCAAGLIGPSYAMIYVYILVLTFVICGAGVRCDRWCRCLQW